jgi:hypothetical protein
MGLLAYMKALISASSFAISFFAFLFRGSRHAPQKFAKHGLKRVQTLHDQVGTGAGGSAAGDAAVDVVDDMDAAAPM